MRCFKKTVCIVGATAPLQKLQEETARNIKQITLAHGVDQFRQILQLMVDNIKKDPKHNINDFPVIHQILGRYIIIIKINPCRIISYPFYRIQFITLTCLLIPYSHTAGVATKDIALCESLFPCSTHAADLDIPTHRREGRATCKAVNAVCPGISIGCALCGGFLPGTCGDQCIIAGIYCGSSLIACGQQKESSKRKPKLTHGGIYF